MQKAQDASAWAQRSVRFGAARRDGQGHLNAASEFSPLYQFFPAREKSSMSRKKNGTEGKIRSQVKKHFFLRIWHI